MGGNTDGDGTTAEFKNPTGVVAAGGGTLYIADSGNHLIREVSVGATAAATQVSTIAGTGTAGNVDNARGTVAQFNTPLGLAIRGSTLYIADYNGHRIRAIDLGSANKTVSTIAGSGTMGGYADGAGSTARFNDPLGIAVSGTTLYVADSGNHRIRAIDIATKTVGTIAGDGTSGTKNGLGIAARFRRPVGIAVSGSTIYVSTLSGRLIRKLEYREV